VATADGSTGGRASRSFDSARTSVPEVLVTLRMTDLRRFIGRLSKRLDPCLNQQDESVRKKRHAQAHCANNRFGLAG